MDVTAISGEGAKEILDGMNAFDGMFGYDVAAYPPKIIFEMATRKGPCVMVVIDPIGDVVVHGTDIFPTPTCAFFRGAMLGDNIKEGWILRDASLVFNLLSGELVSVGNILEIMKPREDEEEAKRIIAGATQ